jgi:ankyrin repeat protein
MSGLMLASSYGAVDVCQVLIDNKCDLDSRDVINCITNVI